MPSSIQLKLNGDKNKEKINQESEEKFSLTKQTHKLNKCYKTVE